MREGALPDLRELAVSIKETGLLHPPLVRATGDADVPYELLAGRRRFGAMQLLDEAEGAPADWRFTRRRRHLAARGTDDAVRRELPPVQARAGHVRPGRAADHGRGRVADRGRGLALVGAPARGRARRCGCSSCPSRSSSASSPATFRSRPPTSCGAGSRAATSRPTTPPSLVEQHAAGGHRRRAKHGVGYVPPPPKNYDALSRGLDEARFRRARPRRRTTTPTRDWRRPATARRLRGARRGRRRSAPLVAEELDAYLLGVFLARAA